MIVKESDLKKFHDGLLNHFWFFRNPTVREIKSGCEGVNAGQNLIDDIMSIREDEYLAVEPRQTWIEDRFLKDGPIFKIKLPKTKGDFFEKKTTPSVISEQIKSRKTKKSYRGYGWRAPSDKTMRLVPLNSIMAGLEILYFFAPEIYERSENENASKLYFYLSENPTKIHSKDYGKYSIISVPSRTEDKIYEFKIESIPVDDRYYTWSKTKPTGHDCGFNLYFSLGKYENGIILWCPHTVSGYEYILWKSQEGKRDKIHSNPFIVPSEEDMRFYDNLRKVIVIGENRPLKISEKEALLWKYFIGKERKVEKPLSSYVIKVLP